MCQTRLRQDHCSTSVLGHMATVHQCRYEVGLPVLKASQCVNSTKEGAKKEEAGGEAAAAVVSSEDFEARGV